MMEVSQSHLSLQGGGKARERPQEVGCSSSTMQLMPSLQQKVLIMQISLHSSTALSPSTTRDMPTAVLTCTTQVAGGSLYRTLCRCRARTSPYPKTLIFPVNKESESEIKCPGRRITAGHWKARFRYPELSNRVIYSTEIPFVWHPEPTAITAWSRTTLDPCFKTKIPPSPEEQALSARLWFEGEFWQTSQTCTILLHLAAEEASVPDWS